MPYSVPQSPTALPTLQTRGTETVRDLPKVTQRSEAKLELKPGAWALNPHGRWRPIHKHKVASQAAGQRQ